jgi:hypothetical protein
MDLKETTEILTENEITEIPTAPEFPKSLAFSIPLTQIAEDTYSKSKADLNLILPKLYLGSVEAARNLDLLKHLNISHILTIEDNSLDGSLTKHFEYKYIKLSDLPSSNILAILEECFEFIDNAIENSSGILVHWY